MKDVEVKSLKGKTILVTGSGKGLGSAIAVEAARQGAKVAVHYRSSEKNAYQVFEEVRAFGQDCTLTEGRSVHPGGSRAPVPGDGPGIGGN